MVNLYTNESNPAALKLLICANFSKTAVQIQNVNITDKSVKEPKHLPYLELDETVIFSSNAAAKYLFPSEAGNDEIDNQWLEFEATQLAPSLAFVIGGSSRSDKNKTSLSTSLKTLNDHLNGQNTFNEKKIGLSDVVIWATLYPLSMDSNLAQEHMKPFSNLMKWLKTLQEQDKFKKALLQFQMTSATLCYQAMLSGAKYLVSTTTSSVETQGTCPENVSDDEMNSAKTSFKKTLVDLTKPKKDIVPVLPVAGEKNILITSALPYVNNVPHLGNIIGCVLSADVFARFARLCNWNTLFVCGTDEYGTATETKALEEGVTPRQICDKYFEIHNAIYRWFNIGFDYFGRTSTPEQTKLVQEMFLALHHNGFVDTQDVEQLCCEKCSRFLADRFVEGGCPHPGCTYEDARGDQCDGCGKLINAIELKNPKCKVCRSTPVVKISTQFFIDLPKIEPLLLHWSKTSSSNWSHNAQVITKAWLKEGLKARCITRDLKWGIPVPLDGYRDKVFYVWFDAPLGYMSITERYTSEWKKWWQPEKNTDISLYQFMAKDNVPFHSVMFPAYLMGVNKGYTLVTHIMATEYLNYEDGKFSKSRGVGVFGTDAQNTGIPSDVWRFYLLYVRPEGQDSSFSWVDLATKNNSELLNNLGNFINRALVFAEKNFNSTIPKMDPTESDYTVLALCSRELKGYITSLEKAKLRDGIRHILAISKHGNQYMQSTQPWVLLKGTDEEKIKAGTVIGICCNIVCLLATLMFPYMPESSRNLKKQLNAPDDASILNPECPEIVTYLVPGHKIGKPAPLFNKIEQVQIEEMKSKFGGTQSEKAQGDAPQNVVALEKAVENQATKVRTLKSSGVPKTSWQPEVLILLDLKKQLEQAQKTAGTAPPKNASPVTQDGAALEKAIQEQAEKVRSLKSSGASKPTWQPEVAILLDLKKQLEVLLKANASTINTAVPSPADVAKLEEEVNKQGEKVRALKSSGASKPTWQPEVAILLDLKKKLEVAQKSNTSSGVVIPSQEDIAKLEEEVNKQGLVVRTLKSKGASKVDCQPQVDILLELKGKLAVMKGEPLATPGKGKKK